MSTGAGAGSGVGGGSGGGAGGSGSACAGTGVGTSAGTGTSGSATGGGSTGGGNSGARRPGTGVFACIVSGNCVVVFSGTLVSGVLENTGAFSAWFGVTGGRTVMARLVPGWAAGLIGLTYW